MYSIESISKDGCVFGTKPSSASYLYYQSRSELEHKKLSLIGLERICFLVNLKFCPSVGDYLFYFDCTGNHAS